MRELQLPLAGVCRCGQIAIRVTRLPLLTSACHCAGCQKMSSSAYSLTSTFPVEGFEVLEGEPVIGGLHGTDVHHYFCGHCMSWMFTRPAGMDWFVNVRPTMFADTGWFRPFIETYTSQMLPFAQTGAMKSYERFPEMTEYEGLMKEYDAWSRSRFTPR
ncbi:aldehyde-activating protein [Aliihoeflea aestuarii]|jgi:hypothetical protein|uniref:GFA family protein n=1 Tax=Aliihoeflea aestuarii TaxID=453840 RepID=UPI002095E415|nr:GFA family protein [Aliihoeflea aestuarii]MCO6393068.1 aldehyde-activating protein [Aliihoeflea aestuarii]